MRDGASSASARRDPLLRFLLLAASLYAAWYLLYAFVLHPWGGMDHAVIDALIATAAGILRLLGYTLIPEPLNADHIRTIGVEGGHLLWIGDPCNGVSLFAVFVIFLLAYGGPWKHKGWFAVLGILSIHLVNALRVAALCIIVSINYEWLNFNHDYTFYVIVYGWVFLLWYIWVKRFVGSSSLPTRG
jgi:exosortase family protein XrtF